MAPDVTSSGYSGLGLRHLGMARALSAHHDVELLAAGHPDDWHGPFRILTGAEDKKKALREAEFVVSATALGRDLLHMRGHLITDDYDPFLFEWLSLDEHVQAARADWLMAALQTQSLNLRTSRAVLLANTRQRDFYLGLLLGRARLGTFPALREDRLLERLLVVPNGIPDTPIGGPTKSAARAQLRLPDDAFILLWGGGVWDWLDPFTVVRAVAAARRLEPRVHLIFLGLNRQPERDPHQTRIPELLALLKSDRLLGEGVTVNDRWVTPEDRLTYLRSADLSVLGQYDNLESHFAFRTRLIDSLWAGMPVLSVEGDTLVEQGVLEGWAVTSRTGNHAEMADRIVRLAGADGPCSGMQAAASTGRARRMWPSQVDPLLELFERTEPLSDRQRALRATAATPSLTAAAARRRSQRWLGKVKQ